MFVDAIKLGFQNYVNFSGRAPRWQYWYWVLFNLIAGIAASIIDGVVFDGGFEGAGPIYLVTSLALLIPSISVAVRRLHDIDRTGWWVLIALTIIGIILLIVWHCTRGTPGPNRFGADPLAAGS
jgi:uncharacterized membrane protein YhaH (DUF805 family)